MINCIIIDDDPVSISLMKHYIASTAGLSLSSTFENPIDGINYIRKNSQDIDVIFLDVEMPKMTGLEVLESFQELPPVILITTKEKYAVKAFTHKVLHYLVKPIEYSMFLKAVDRVFNLQEANNAGSSKVIFVKENGVLTKLVLKEIYYFEALGDYVKVHTQDMVHTVNSTMKNLEEKLRPNKSFIRVQRSYLINLEYLKNFDHETAVVAGKVIPIGNKYRSELQSRLNII
jgi:two-component system, LytTR family, response regulator